MEEIAVQTVATQIDRTAIGAKAMGQFGGRLSMLAPTQAELELTEDGAPVSKAMLTTADVDALIFALARLRAKMTPEVPRAIQSTDVRSGLDAPKFTVFAVPSIAGKGLSVRHPGFGWLTFFWKDDDAAKLAHGLLVQAEIERVLLN